MQAVYTWLPVTTSSDQHNYVVHISHANAQHSAHSGANSIQRSTCINQNDNMKHAIHIIEYCN